MFGKNNLGNFEFCRNFVYGKSHRVRYNRLVHTTRKVLDYGHTYFWGTSRVQLHDGGKYFLSLASDTFRKLHVDKMKRKDERIMMENKTSRKLRNFIQKFLMLKSDSAHWE